MSTYSFLTMDRQDETTWVTINREVDRNSINSALMGELTRAITSAEEKSARAIVFASAGSKYFVGGADGVEMMQCDPEEAKAFSHRIQGLFNRIESSTLVTVAAIDGLCFGGGFELAMACDLRVATESSRIGLPEVKVGLIPGGGGTQRLVRLVGFGRALQMILSGHLTTASEARELGLVHAVTAPDQLTADVTNLLAPMLRVPRYAQVHAKRALYASSLGSIEVGLAVESEQFSRCFEHSFFPKLMRQQLDDGVLTTTEDLSRLTNKEGER